MASLINSLSQIFNKILVRLYSFAFFSTTLFSNFSSKIQQFISSTTYPVSELNLLLPSLEIFVFNWDNAKQPVQGMELQEKETQKD